MRYEIHFTIESGDDAAVEAAVNAAYYLIEDRLDGVGTMTAQAARRSDEDGPPETTGWHDWDEETDETYYRRRT